MLPTLSLHDPDTPNPFAMAMSAPNRSLKKRLWRSVRTLLATLAITAILLGSVYFGKQFLLNRLVDGLDRLEPTAKQTRLLQIASFGDAAIRPLVACLVDPDDAASESAFRLLQKMQNNWITLDGKSALAAHRVLVSAMQSTYAKHIREDQTMGDLTGPQLSRGRELLNQTVLEYAANDSTETGSYRSTAAFRADASEVVRSANALIDVISSRPGSEGSEVAGDRSAESRRHIGLDSKTGWTDWPPRSHSAQVIRSGPRTTSVARGPAVLDGISEVVSEGAEGSPDDRLRPISPGVTVPLGQIVTPRPPKVLAARRPVNATGSFADDPASADSGVRLTTHLSQSPMTALGDETVIRHLANPDAMITGQAKTELIGRGFTPSQLEMAQNLATAGPADRIRLVDALVHSSQFDSGPWLSMLLDDPDRKVRLHVVSTLAPSLANDRDPALLKRLRERLDREDDWHVATRIRKSLELR